MSLSAYIVKKENPVNLKLKWISLSLSQFYATTYKTASGEFSFTLNPGFLLFFLLNA